MMLEFYTQVIGGKSTILLILLFFLIVILVTELIFYNKEKHIRIRRTITRSILFLFLCLGFSNYLIDRVFFSSGNYFNYGIKGAFFLLLLTILSAFMSLIISIVIVKKTKI